MNRVRRVRETALCAFVAALVVAPGAGADLVAAPCVGAGLVAIVPPGATAPTTLGPAITAATTTGAEAATFHDAQYSVDLAEAQAGGAGCVRSTAPGGTHAASHRWSVLGAVSGDSLRADLVPAGGDGSGWHLRTTINALRVGTRAVDVVAGTTVPVSNWATLTMGVQADLPKLAPLRYWAAALEVKLTHAHAGLPAGTIVLIGYAAANQRTGETAAAARDNDGAHHDDRADDDRARTDDDRADHDHEQADAAGTKQPPKKKPKPPKKKAPKNTRSASRSPARPPLEGRVRLPGPRADRLGRHVRRRRARTFRATGTTATTCSRKLGTPVVAVADGTVFAVGWNRVGGWRLWLRDRSGNAFYYAHLAGYTRSRANNPRSAAATCSGSSATPATRTRPSAPALRGAPERAAVPRLRRCRRPDDVPGAVASPAGRRCCRRSSCLRPPPG